MPNKIRGLVLIGLLGFLTCYARANTTSTADAVFLSNMKEAILTFQDEHESKLPAKWSDLDPYIDGGVEEAFSWLQATERYALLSPPISFTKPFQGELIMVTRRAFQEAEVYGDMGEESRLSELRHYILYRNSVDGTMFKRLSEPEVAGLFKSAGAARVAEDTLTERLNVANFRKIQTRKCIVGLAVLSISLMLLIVWRVRKKA